MAPMTAPNATPLSGSELVAFTVALEVGSIHGAADALDLTPSAVTKRIRNLERRLAVTLFERGRFGLRATEQARLLYPEAKQAVLALERAEATIADRRAATASVLSLAASHTTGEFLLPGWLAEFRLAHPGLRAQVDIVNSTGVLARLREREVDIGLVEGLDALDEFDAICVWRDEIVVVVAAGHRWARRRSVAASELVDGAYVTREAGSGTRAVAAAALREAGVELTPALELASFQSVKRALDGGSFSLLSRLAIEAELAAGSVHALPLRDGGLHRELRAVRRRGQANAATSAFWNWLAALG
jgi:DNA-binding transcriptional LysR family regulator